MLTFATALSVSGPIIVLCVLPKFFKPRCGTYLSFKLCQTQNQIKQCDLTSSSQTFAKFVYIFVWRVNGQIPTKILHLKSQLRSGRKPIYYICIFIPWPLVISNAIELGLAFKEVLWFTDPSILNNKIVSCRQITLKKAITRAATNSTTICWT